MSKEPASEFIMCRLERIVRIENIIPHGAVSDLVI